MITTKKDLFDFLPEWYTLPENSNSKYTKLWDGDTKIRFLKSPVFAWRIFVEDEDWKKKKIIKPYEKQNPISIPDWAIEKYWKHSRLCLIRNYNEECIQIRDLDK